jgi:hypothetical protein
LFRLRDATNLLLLIVRSAPWLNPAARPIGRLINIVEVHQKTGFASRPAARYKETNKNRLLTCLAVSAALSVAETIGVVQLQQK